MQQGCFQFEAKPSGVFEIIDGPAPYFKKSKVFIQFPYGWLVGKTGSEYELRVRILPTGTLLQAMPLLEVVY
ncbi:MAG: hypothetical protein FD123_2286 [Bacteroidetes bacterium]|nr:MAG: hypothetical protein FD123_2286 [Bacteroidota bacterium]